MPMIATTIITSIKVNPRLWALEVCVCMVFTSSESHASCSALWERLIPGQKGDLHRSQACCHRQGICSSDWWLDHRVRVFSVCSHPGCKPQPDTSLCPHRCCSP